MTILWKWYLVVSGWNTRLTFPYGGLKKFIVIVGPHTSNWDFIVGLAYRSILGLGYVRFLGKKELFRPPFGWLFRMLGGIPVDRQHTTNLVEAAASLFQANDHFALALSPEGTRRKVEKLKTGFYYIALRAGVPVIMAGLDYRNKSLRFGPALFPADLEKDLSLIMDFYDGIQGRYPDQGITKKRTLSDQVRS